MNQDIEIPQRQAPFHVGESIRVISGPFEDFTAKIDGISEKDQRVRALISWHPFELKDGERMYLHERPREVSVELGFEQIERTL